MQEIATPVLIVGGGAAGTSVAIELGSRGIGCLVVEQTDGVIHTPKTGHISARTMEHCRRWGIVEQVWDAGFPRDFPLDTIMCTSLSGYDLGRKATPSINDTRPLASSPENRIRCPQMLFDPLLARTARGLDSVCLEYGWRLDGFTVLSDRTIVSSLTDLANGEKLRVHSEHLVGADGAASTVRSALGIETRGKGLLNYSLIILFRCPEFLSFHDKGPAERYVFIRSSGWAGNITVVNGSDIWRLGVKGQPGRFDLDAFDPTAAVKEAFGRDDVEFEILKVQPWKRTQLVADHYVDGNVLLVGDAVHTMSPTGGFGMNTAIDDAVNLGWKLAAMHQGWGGPNLLPSYEVERRPVGIRNSLAAAENFELWMSQPAIGAAVEENSAEGDEARRQVAKSFDLVADRVQGSEGVILGVRYDPSPICIPDGTPLPPDEYATYVPVSRHGSRAPHVWIGDDRSTLDLFGGGFCLLYTPEAEIAAGLLVERAKEIALPMQAEMMESPQYRAVYAQRLVLVRPDGHIAYAGDDIDDAQAASAILDRARGR